MRNKRPVLSEFLVPLILIKDNEKEKIEKQKESSTASTIHKTNIYDLSVMILEIL